MTKDRIEQLLTAVAQSKWDVAMAECAVGHARTDTDIGHAARAYKLSQENCHRVFHEAVAELVAALPLVPGEEAPMQVEKENTDVHK